MMTLYIGMAALNVDGEARSLTAESVRAANAALGATELTEANAKAVNEIHLATIGKEVDHFTTVQTSALFEIANQCPMLGGNSVFKARSLYWLIDDSYDFDDPMLCLQHGLVTKNLKQPVVNALNMVPNPAMDEVTLVLTAALEEAGTLLFYNAQGAEVLRMNVPKDQQRTALSTETWAPGMYHYRLLSTTGDVGAGKLSIVR